MKKVNKLAAEEPRSEYKRSDFGTLERADAVNGDVTDVTRPAPICVLAVYTGIRCQPFFARDHTGCSFTRRIEMSLPTCMSSGKRER
jgi:hypothetical protein